MWTLQTATGDYEADTLEQMVDSVADFHSDDIEPRLPSFTGLYYSSENGGGATASSAALAQVEYAIEESFTQLNKEAEEEAEHRRQLRADYWASR